MEYETKSLSLDEYERDRAPTDKMSSDIVPLIFGLYGEVGSVMSTSKKHYREKEVFTGYREAAVEELGDAVWYLAAICRRANLSLEAVFREAISDTANQTKLIATSLSDWTVAVASRDPEEPNLDASLLRLGEATAAILALGKNAEESKLALANVAREILRVLNAANISLGEVLATNLHKTRGRFLDVKTSELPVFDDTYDEDEQIPRQFEIGIRQRKSGKTYLQWNGVFLGDPLTDNIREEDGYRFHDVFHLAHAAILAWSPVFRALIKHKRKSTPDVDEHQDSGRAIVVEEGLTAWVFSQAKEVGFFEGQSALPFDMLKTVQKFVAGYEVERCPLKLWEEAILQGYHAFVRLNKTGEGVIYGDLERRTIEYRARKA